MRVGSDYLERKRREIGRVAMEMYCREGRDVPVSAICAAAGIAKGTLFRYFPTRDAMFRELFEGCRAHARGLADEGVERGADDEATVKALIRHSLVWPTAFPLEFQFVVMYTEAESFYIFDADEAGSYRFDALDDPRHVEVVRRMMRPGIPEELAHRQVSALVNTTCRYLTSRGIPVDDPQVDVLVDAMYDAAFVRGAARG